MSLSTKVSRSQGRKITIRDLDVEHLSRSIEIYKALSSQKQKLFLQRNLSYSRRFIARTRRRKRLLGVSFNTKIEKKFKPHGLDDEKASSVELANAENLQVFLDNIDDSLSAVMNNVEIEANLLKLNGSLANKTSLNGIVLNKLGRFDVHYVKGQSKKRQSSFNDSNNSKTVINIPSHAFEPLNGHLSWCSWLVLRCQWSMCEKTDRSLRRFGHRESSKWPMNNGIVSKTAVLPICKNGEKSLSNREMSLSLWPNEKSDGQLLTLLKKVFSPKFRAFDAHSILEIDRPDVDAFLNIRLLWKRRPSSGSKYQEHIKYVDLKSSAEKFSPISNDLNCAAPPIIHRTSSCLSAAEFFNKLSSLNKSNGDKKRSPAPDSSASIASSRNLCDDDHCSENSKLNQEIKSVAVKCGSQENAFPKFLMYRFHCHRRLQDFWHAAYNDNEPELTGLQPTGSPKKLHNRDVGRLNTVADSPNRCPFCNTATEDLYCLFMHLRLCHSRFLFYYVDTHKNPIKHIIDVAVDANFTNRSEISSFITIRRRWKFYDRRKYLNPLPRKSRLLFLYTRNKSETKRCKRSLDQFKFGSPTLILMKPPVVYTKRQYYHSQSCNPLLEGDMESDSENETDPDWLRVIRCKLIDEFTDVNDGEKRIMKMWNLHVMKFNFFGDDRVFHACCSFLNAHGDQIIREGGRLNFDLHLINLYNYGLLSQKQLLSLTTRLNETKINYLLNNK